MPPHMKYVSLCMVVSNALGNRMAIQQRSFELEIQMALDRKKKAYLEAGGGGGSTQQQV